MLVKTKYNIGDLVIIRTPDGNNHYCKIIDITIYLHNNKKHYMSYLCIDIKSLINYSVTSDEITKYIKVYKIRKWLSKIFYNLYLKFDKIW